MVAKGAKPKKKYLIALAEKHSVVALLAGLIVLFCSLSAIIVRLMNYDQTGENPLHYFTVLSNLLSAIGAAFMIPYAIEGIYRKQFVLPRFVILFQFSGAICVSITMLTSLALILPLQGVREAIGGTDFWLHLISPACTILLFLCVETGVVLSRKEAALCLLPFFIYIAVYFVMVVLVGKENGGWADIYRAQAFWPFWISLLLFLAIGLIVSTLLHAAQTRRAVQTRRDIARGWRDDLSETELLIEAFGLGRYIGAKTSFGQLSVPLDIFSAMAERYNIPLDKLAKAYIRGALDSAEERRAGQEEKSVHAAAQRHRKESN